MDYKIAIIGPKDIISGFKALGVIPFDSETSEDTLRIIKDIKKDSLESDKKFAVVIVIESLIKNIPEEEYQKVSSGPLPAILSIPGIEGSSGVGLTKLKKLAEKAIGSDILN